MTHHQQNLEQVAAAPGPWNWVASDAPSANGGLHAYVVDANGRKIAAVWGKTGEKEATAHLMAAAPAMRAAAEALLAKIGDVTGIESERRAMMSALNDAKGTPEGQVAA